MPDETCAFGPLTVSYDQTVLVPRPWTLAQSDWATELAATAPAGPVLELCAGVGHIGLVVAVRTGRRLVQVDSSDRACAFARANAAAAGAAPAVEVRCAPLTAALAADERFALVIADPPYVPSASVGRFPEDPVVAIDGGADGLDLVRACLGVAAAHLLPGGEVVLQVGSEAQAEAAGRLADGLSVAAIRSCGPDRVLVRLVRAADAEG